MNGDSYEPYEVSLSNSQIAAFVALLVLAIVGAFAAGAWWGRLNALELASAGEADAAVALPDLAVREAVVSTDGDAADGDASGGDVADGEPAAEVVRFFGPDEAGPPTTSARPAPAAASAEASLVVQVFSSADIAQAASVEQKLRADGHSAFVSPLTLDGQVMQRVRVGPFEDQDAAAAAAEQLSKQYGLETWITPNN